MTFRIQESNNKNKDILDDIKKYCDDRYIESAKEFDEAIANGESYSDYFKGIAETYYSLSMLISSYKERNQ